MSIGIRVVSHDIAIVAHDSPQVAPHSGLRVLVELIPKVVAFKRRLMTNPSRPDKAQPNLL